MYTRVVTCLMYPEKFIRDNVVAPFLQLSTVIVIVIDRIVVGDLLDDADHDLFRKVCHSHHSLNLLLPPKRIFTNLCSRAGHPFQLPEYITLLDKKSFIVRVLYEAISMFYPLDTDSLDLVRDCDFFSKRCFPFVCAFVT